MNKLKESTLPESESQKQGTGVHEENLDCKEMIRDDGEKDKLEEEKKNKPRKRLRPAHKRDTTPKYKYETPIELAEISKMNMHREPEKIIGMTTSTGEIMVFFKWKGCQECDLIPVSDAFVIWPKIMNKYYEERTKSSNVFIQ